MNYDLSSPKSVCGSSVHMGTEHSPRPGHVSPSVSTESQGIHVSLCPDRGSEGDGRKRNVIACRFRA
jgi:hypothetical protein